MRTSTSSLDRFWTPRAGADWELVRLPIDENDTFEVDGITLLNHKWSGILHYLTSHPGWKDMDYVWFPDDDLVIDPADVEKFFHQCKAQNARLASPTLAPGSYFSHPLTLSNVRFEWRRTTFVEIMMPCFQVEFLEQAVQTMKFSRSGLGFGLDFVWPLLLGFKDIYLFDNIKVLHMRPVGMRRDGKWASSFQNRMAEADKRWIIDGFSLLPYRKCLGGLSRDGILFPAAEGLFYSRLLSGYEYISFREAKFAESLLLSETQTWGQEDLQRRAERLKSSVVQVGKADRPLSLGKPSRVSSVGKWSFFPTPEEEGSGGNSGIFNGTAGFHTDLEQSPWWQVDLGDLYAIREIRIFNRIDMADRFVNFDVCVSADSVGWTAVFAKRDDRMFGGIDGNELRIELAGVLGRYVRVTSMHDGFLHLDQVQVF